MQPSHQQGTKGLNGITAYFTAGYWPLNCPAKHNAFRLAKWNRNRGKSENIVGQGQSFHFLGSMVRVYDFQLYEAPHKSCLHICRISSNYLPGHSEAHPFVPGIRPRGSFSGDKVFKNS